jgi:hypothetical protein
MQSTIINRVASGERQCVDKGNPVNEHNVIHAAKQYQGVPSDVNAKQPRKGNFQNYKSGKATDSGAKNAEIADQNLRRMGRPVNDATSFIVNNGGAAPSDKQVRSLGNVQPAGRVGDVYLFKEKPRPSKK